jgi:HPt (histidine-containing phosphotransfer) domain-containing protein
VNVELDAKTLAQIRKIGGDELLARLARLYLEHTPVRIEEMRRGLAVSNWKRTALAIHSLRSSSVTLGAVDLAESAADLEKLAEAGKKDELERALPVLESMTQAVLQAVGELA